MSPGSACAAWRWALSRTWRSRALSSIASSCSCVRNVAQISASTRCSSAPRSTGSTPRLTRGIGSARSRISACALNGQRDCNSTRAGTAARIGSPAAAAHDHLVSCATSDAGRRAHDAAIPSARGCNARSFASAIRSSSGLRARCTSPSRCGQLNMTFGSAARPALQLSRRLLQNTARRGFRNACDALQLQRNQRVRIHRRRDVIGVEAGHPQRIEVHARAGGAVDHRDRGAGSFGLEWRVAQQVAQARERLLQVHAPRDRIERAELGEHAVKFFERLMLDAAQCAIARPTGRQPERVKVLGPAAGRPAAQGLRTTALTSRAATCSCGQSVSAAQRSISNQFQRSRCSSRSRRSASARCDRSTCPPTMNGVRKQSAGIGARALARRELQHEQRSVDERIVRHRHRRRDHNRNRQRAAQRLSRGRHEDIFEHAPHFFATRRRGRRGSRRRCPTPASDLVARPLRGEIELCSSVVGRNDRDVAVAALCHARSRRRDPSRATVRAIASSPAASRRSRRRRCAPTGSVRRRRPTAASGASSTASMATQRRSNSRHHAYSAWASGVSNACRRSMGIR